MWLHTIEVRLTDGTGVHTSVHQVISEYPEATVTVHRNGLSPQYVGDDAMRSWGVSEQEWDEMGDYEDYDDGYHADWPSAEDLSPYRD